MILNVNCGNHAPYHTHNPQIKVFSKTYIVLVAKVWRFDGLASALALQTCYLPTAATELKHKKTCPFNHFAFYGVGRKRRRDPTQLWPPQPPLYVEHAAAQIYRELARSSGLSRDASAWSRSALRARETSPYYNIIHRARSIINLCYSKVRP